MVIEQHDLVVVNPDPFNAETPLDRLEGIITPTQRFYVRNHFAVPTLDPARWRLHLDGEVRRALDLSLDDIKSLPARTVSATLECAGNGRSTLAPIVEGEQWTYGAVSTGEWTGASLREVLNAAGVRPDAPEVLFVGADSGMVGAAGRVIPFERSLPLDKAMHPDTILVYAMNGEALTPMHGFPLRLIVPGWYGVASVKWLQHVSVLREPFKGFYQADRYVLEFPDGSEITPLNAMAVRSIIVDPAPEAVVPGGDTVVRGYAWSGSAAIQHVYVSVGDGPWKSAELTSEAEPYVWRSWQVVCRLGPGDVDLRSKAVDAGGNEQPSEPRWNTHGYANNAVHVVRVRGTTA